MDEKEQGSEQAADLAPSGQWCMYLLECRNGALYTGITNDLHRRMAAHAAGKGAKYTRANPPSKLVGSVAFQNRSEASKAEWVLKKLPRSKKADFFLRIARNGMPSTAKRASKGKALAGEAGSRASGVTSRSLLD